MAKITLRAEKAGKTILTGSSTLQIGGEHLVVEGLVTNRAVTSTLPSDSSQESRWVGLFGSNHRVDHCQFEGKSGKGTTFVVFLGNDARSTGGIRMIGEDHIVRGNYLERLTGSDGFFGKSLGIPVIAGIDTSSPTIEALDAISRNEVGPSW